MGRPSWSSSEQFMGRMSSTSDGTGLTGSSCLSIQTLVLARRAREKGTIHLSADLPCRRPPAHMKGFCGRVVHGEESRSSFQLAGVLGILCCLALALRRHPPVWSAIGWLERMQWFQGERNRREFKDRKGKQGP